MIDRKTKNVLFRLARSHSKLAQAEYNRNPRGFHAANLTEVEGQYLAYLNEMGLHEEFFSYMTLADKQGLIKDGGKGNG